MIKKPFIILCGPSGAGKSTLVQNMLDEMSSALARTISSTTRDKRPSEVDGKDYFFLSKEDFFKKIANGEFLEWARVYDHYYGTSKEQVETFWQKGKAIIKDLDLQGLKSVKESYPQSLTVGVFPSSKEEAKSRMAQRAVAPNEDRSLRLDAYQDEVAELKKCSAVQIINDDLKKACADLKSEIEKYLF